jgi:excisionase family DNA binding protein
MALLSNSWCGVAARSCSDEQRSTGVPRREKGSGPDDMSSRMSIPEIANRLSVGRIAVYTMLEQGIIPAVRLGRRWIVTRHAYEQWERTCGMRTGLQPGPEYKVT